MFSIFILFCDYCGERTDYLAHIMMLKRKKFACRECEKKIKKRWNQIHFLSL